MLKGMIFDVARAAMDDGPGVRTTIFLKGCPLRCPWCHNPESQRFSRESARDKYGKPVVYGQELTPQEILAIAERDRSFYRLSGGGVTFSGGEPLAQVAFLAESCRLCHEAGLHVCVDTSGFASEEAVHAVMPYVDLFLLDYKQTGEERHERDVGVPLSPVLDTLALLRREGKRVWLRCPIVPGYQDRPEHFRAIAALEREYPCIERVELMVFHTLGRHKYAQLRRRDPTADLTPFTEEEKEAFWRMLNDDEAQMGIDISERI